MAARRAPNVSTGVRGEVKEGHVEQLSWTDDMMLRAERPETPMQIQMLLIYDQSTAPQAESPSSASSKRSTRDCTLRRPSGGD